MQTVIALIIVVLCAAYLVRSLWPSSQGGCGSGCASCPSAQSSQVVKTLVTLELPEQKR
ncbi:MAG: FeoB-associated Cys-rich membrane protein [Planctomycetaceae bacterium]|nr:FeoB-associated Cys-rich membrane protein [Planctomycetaceae bacterium]